MRQQQAGGPVIPSPSRQGVIQHTVSYPQQQRYPGPSPPVRAMPGSGHQWRPVHHMQQMADPMSGGAASRMIRPPGGPYNMHPAAMQQQHQQHHHQQQLLQQQQQQQHHHQMQQQQQQVHSGSMMAGPVQTAPGGQPNMQTQQQQAWLEKARFF
jgi:acyl-homoserine lactone acylase PvdQ